MYLMAKNYCYKSTCKFVETGFQIEQYLVCTHCKEEVTPELKTRKEEELEQERKREERRKTSEANSEEDPFVTWHYY